MKAHGTNAMEILKVFLKFTKLLIDFIHYLNYNILKLNVESLNLYSNSK